MDIRLLVLRTGDIKKLADFYILLGFNFTYHQHDKSPFHYSAQIGQTVVEIYPLAKSQLVPDNHLRMGFGIDDFTITIQKLQEVGIKFLMEPAQTEFGWMAIIADPDGRKIELYKK
jgi:lactoylglutathione lyase